MTVQDTYLADVRIENHGSIILLRPLTNGGKSWLDENITGDEVQYMGNAVVCEPRYVENIVAGMIADDLEVEA